MRHDRDACTATHTRLGNVSTGEDIKVFALGVPEMASKYNSKELVPALVRRILGNGLFAYYKYLACVLPSNTHLNLFK